jgi:hypothetical protein
MASNIREFEMGLKEFADSIPQQVGQLHRAVMLEGLKGVVLMTPVDTGRARGNWQVSIGSPAVGELETTDKAGGSTIAKGSQGIQQVQPYTVSWITNNLDYIEALEGGHSQQAPAGMLNVTFQRLKGWLGRQK